MGGCQKYKNIKILSKSSYNIIIVKLLKEKFNIFWTTVVEASLACAVLMTQGNVQGISIEHWKIASTTGAAAGVLAVLLSFVPITHNNTVKALEVGVATFAADWWVHPEHYVGEHFMTGFGAAILAFVGSTVYEKFKKEDVSA